MSDLQQITDFSKMISFLLSAVTAGFAVVIWWIIRGLAQDIKEIRGDQINHKAVCMDRYRTKDEAERQWIELTNRLGSMETTAKERYTQMWDKIDKQTALFVQDKNATMLDIRNISDRVSKLDQRVETLEKS